MPNRYAKYRSWWKGIQSDKTTTKNKIEKKELVDRCVNSSAVTKLKEFVEVEAVSIETKAYCAK